MNGSAIPRPDRPYRTNQHRKYDPGSSFDYSFNDDDYAHKFAVEQRIGTLTTVFAVFAIFISCLGLFGLASFTAEQRTREIGIRKILGASILNLWGLLSQEFLHPEYRCHFLNRMPLVLLFRPSLAAAL